ncbi:MAG TPA: hydroxysqualene dehydroxylase HpnE [Tepidisphaeraceae bacterium]|nr:hydroxysqualene dehydroxylase HpnE [Tepidisphaeraceae bacterium]
MLNSAGVSPSTALGSPPRVVIVGGGLAGMAAAVALESAGAAVTLLEARRSFGGRASSFEDPQTGETLDNCQHVLLGCCTNLLDFYRRIGVEHLIRFERTIRFVDARGARYGLSGTPGLPAPLHLGPSMLRFGALSLGERISLSKAMTAMLRLGRSGRLALDDVAFGQWLNEHRQPASLVSKLYAAILIGSLNEDPRRASASYAIQVFQDALLFNASGYVLGLPNCPLGKLYERLPCRDARLGVRVSEVVFAEGVATGVKLQSGEFLPADAVVLATNHHAVQRWIPRELQDRDQRFRHLERLESVPILGAHLWFDRPIVRDSHVAFLQGPLQWLFRKDDEGRAVHGVISAARDWLDVPREQALQQFERQIRATFPEARNAKLIRGVTVIEKRATFSPLPGIDRLRPWQSPSEGGIANLFLAGDYTRTGWPATMEGAVRSGYLAAEAVMSRVFSGPASATRRFLVPDLSPQWPARWMSRG